VDRVTRSFARKVMEQPSTESSSSLGIFEASMLMTFVVVGVLEKVPHKTSFNKSMSM
jgi:hypothetical protein